MDCASHTNSQNDCNKEKPVAKCPTKPGQDISCQDKSGQSISGQTISGQNISGAVSGNISFGSQTNKPSHTG
ncbi:hypothetical protein J4Q44_G00286060 [Coregonus suidteri]|uniref:Uncharacterized protein n=1 Tax=Coregonus suidteri TaxID=861788 RepID=A0AAN8KYV7_9TELE